MLVDLMLLGLADSANGKRVLRGWCDERAKDGVAPELNPGWVHRWINSNSEVRHAVCAQTLGFAVAVAPIKRSNTFSSKPYSGINSSKLISILTT